MLTHSPEQQAFNLTNPGFYFCRPGRRTGNDKIGFAPSAHEVRERRHAVHPQKIASTVFYSIPTGRRDAFLSA
jgi:hypothetical protein